MNTTSLMFLLVDDDPIFLTVAEYVIRSLGQHDVTTATNGQVGLEMLQAADHPFDIIVLDLNMPHMDGIAFIRAAAELGFSGQIIISSGEVDAVRTAAASIGTMLGVSIAGVLAKPIQTEALAAILANIASDERDRPLEAAGAPCRSKLSIIPFYQPQYNVNTGALEGLEALARALDSNNRIYGAETAMGDMADAQNVRDTTLTIHAHVLADMAIWQEAGLDCKVSVNLEAGLLEDSDFCLHLADLHRQSGLPAASTVYEMTEKGMPSDRSRIIENIARLRMAGFGVALDDFGTGAANFDILRACPFSEVKLDRSIIATCGTENHNRQFVEFTVRTAREQRLHVVAEGTETWDEVEFVRIAGIDTVQGYYFDRPMPADKAMNRIRERYTKLTTK